MVLCCWLLARSRGFWLIHQNQFPESPVGFHSRSEPCSELNGGFWGGWLLARLMFPPSTARSMTVGQFLVLAGACQFGHSLGGFTINFIHSAFLVLVGTIPAMPALYHALHYGRPVFWC